MSYEQDLAAKLNWQRRICQRVGDALFNLDLKGDRKELERIAKVNGRRLVSDPSNPGLNLYIEAVRELAESTNIAKQILGGSLAEKTLEVVRQTMNDNKPVSS